MKKRIRQPISMAIFKISLLIMCATLMVGCKLVPTKEDTAQNNFNRTQEKFKIGQVNSIEFRQAQLNLLNAELNRNQAKFSAKLSELQLLQISGDLLNTSF